MPRAVNPLPRLGFPRARLVLAAVWLGLTGCCTSPYPALAGRYAADQVQAASRLAPMGGIAFRLCRQQAVYDFVARAAASPLTEPPLWPRFYGEVEGPDTPKASLLPVTWSQSCGEAAKAVNVVHTVCRGLRQQGRALASLASGDGKSIDTGALQQTVSDVASLTAGKGSVTSVGKAVESVASAFASGANAFVEMIRARQLAEIVVAEQTCMNSTFDDLLALHDVLLRKLADVEARRVELVRGATTSPLPPRGLALLEAMDAVAETDQAQKNTEAALDTYKLAITRMKVAHAQLAKLADRNNPAKPTDVESALGDLESSLQDLTELER